MTSRKPRSLARTGGQGSAPNPSVGGGPPARPRLPRQLCDLARSHALARMGSTDIVTHWLGLPAHPAVPITSFPLTPQALPFTAQPVRPQFHLMHPKPSPTAEQGHVPLRNGSHSACRATETHGTYFTASAVHRLNTLRWDLLSVGLGLRRPGNMNGSAPVLVYWQEPPHRLRQHVLSKCSFWASPMQGLCFGPSWWP